MGTYYCPCPTCGMAADNAEDVLLHIEMFHILTPRFWNPQKLIFNEPGGYEMDSDFGG